MWKHHCGLLLLWGANTVPDVRQREGRHPGPVQRTANKERKLQVNFRRFSSKCATALILGKQDKDCMIWNLKIWHMFESHFSLTFLLLGYVHTAGLMLNSDFMLGSFFFLWLFSLHFTCSLRSKHGGSWWKWECGGTLATSSSGRFRRFLWNFRSVMIHPLKFGSYTSVTLNT